MIARLLISTLILAGWCMAAWGQASSLFAPLTTADAAAVMPAPATSAPPPTGTDSVEGSSVRYARADHTHATSVQRARLQVPTAGTAMEWTFAKPYDAGVVPVVTCTAQAGTNPTQPFVVNTVEAPTATKATIIVFRAQTQTLGGTLLAIAGVTINLFAPAPTGTWVNCQAAKPTQ
jgi:hypothetical protein